MLTAKYISDILGVATVETNGFRKEAGFDGKFSYGMENIATSKRNLMNPDELIKLDNDKVIVMVRGRKPFICNKYDYSEHPLGNEIQEIRIEDQSEKFNTNYISSLSHYPSRNNVKVKEEISKRVTIETF